MRNIHFPDAISGLNNGQSDGPLPLLVILNLSGLRLTMSSIKLTSS